MNKPIIISPSILSANFANLQQELAAIEKAGADWVHIDVMDGHFVPNITMGPFIVEHCKKLCSLPLDVHLMIEKPENHIASFAAAGASWLTIHVEGNPNVYRTLQTIRELGVHPSIAVNPGTPANTIQNVIELVDMVLVMTVNPGFSGQKHIPGMRQKVGEVRALCSNLERHVYIQVDGGITSETLPAMAQAGADSFVAATSIFKHPAGISAGIQELRNCNAACAAAN